MNMDYFFIYCNIIFKVLQVCYFYFYGCFYMASCDCSSLSLIASCTTPLFLVLWPPTPLPSFLSLEHPKNVFTTGPLDLLLLLPGTFFLQPLVCRRLLITHVQHPHPHPSCSQSRTRSSISRSYTQSDMVN